MMFANTVILSPDILIWIFLECTAAFDLLWPGTMLWFSWIYSSAEAMGRKKSKETTSVSACLLHRAWACVCLVYYSLSYSLSFPFSFTTALVNLLINGTEKALGPADSPLLPSPVCLPWLLPHNELMLAPIGVKYCSSSDHSVASAPN